MYPAPEFASDPGLYGKTAVKKLSTDAEDDFSREVYKTKCGDLCRHPIYPRFRG